MGDIASCVGQVNKKFVMEDRNDQSERATRKRR
jgi:hypothetical protein